MKKLIGCSIPLLAACLLLGVLFHFVQNNQHVVAASVRSSPVGTIVVNTLEDELDSDGNCSLREAIEAANTNTPVSGCASGEETNDLIMFVIPGMITLDSQLLVTGGGPLEIDGSGGITVNGAGTDRLIWVYAGSLLKLENLILTGGHKQGDGGGIFNSGTLYLTGSTLSNNIATGAGGGGGIYNSGSLFITSSLVSGNQATEVGAGGGGILNVDYAVSTVLSDTILLENLAMNGGGILSGTSLEIINSTISGNSALRGGGIYNASSLTIDRSTLSENYADIEGGGINNFEVITMTNSTLSGNASLGDFGDGGAIYNHSVPQAMVHILNSTVARNISTTGGAGIKNSAFVEQLIIANSIVGDNIPTDCYGQITDGNNNIESSDTCGFDPAKGSKFNTTPMLGPLQDNGGPTLTHGFLWTSPAIDTGDEALCPPTDQRGITRPKDGNGDGLAVCDIGAYELIEPPYIQLLPLMSKSP